MGVEWGLTLGLQASLGDLHGALQGQCGGAILILLRSRAKLTLFGFRVASTGKPDQFRIAVQHFASLACPCLQVGLGCMAVREPNCRRMLICQKPCKN